MKGVATRVRAVGQGKTINGTYKMSPTTALDAFRGDLIALTDLLGEASPLFGPWAQHLRSVSDDRSRDNMGLTDPVLDAVAGLFERLSK